MARVYSHRRGNTQKKAKPMEAMYAATLSVVSFISYMIIISISASNAGENSNWLGGAGMLGFCLAIGTFLFNIGQMKTNTDLTERIICMSISSITLLVWVVTFLIGMFA